MGACIASFVAATYIARLLRASQRLRFCCLFFLLFFLIGFWGWGFRVVVQRYYWGVGVTIARMGDLFGIFYEGLFDEFAEGAAAVGLEDL